MHESIHIERDAAEVRRVRRWLAGELARADLVTVDQVDVVLVMVSELVTNVLRHTAFDAVVTARTYDDQLVVEVEDGDPNHPHRREPAEYLSLIGGYGMCIVEEFSDGWGVRPRHDGSGKAVWFSVGLQPAA